MSDQKSHSTEQPERKEHFVKRPDWEQRLRFSKTETSCPEDESRCIKKQKMSVSECKRCLEKMLPFLLGSGKGILLDSHHTTFIKELILLCAQELWLSHSPVTGGHPVVCRNIFHGRLRL